jgi:hypothetical protein
VRPAALVFGDLLGFSSAVVSGAYAKLTDATDTGGLFGLRFN